jgi:hypothetical protein
MGKVEKPFAKRLYWLLTLFFSGVFFGVVGAILSVFFHLFTSTATPMYLDPLQSLLALTVIFSIVVGVATGLLSWPFYLFLLIKKLFRLQHIERILPWLRGGVFALSIVSAVCFWLYIDEPIIPPEAVVLHAAIKNTCVFDPRRENCPQNLEGIGIVEPGNFATVKATSQMRYTYDPMTNQYSFVVRYGKRNGIIFDQRLFPDLDVKQVRFEPFGADHIIDPPAYPGPWDNWPDWDKGI